MYDYLKNQVLVLANNFKMIVVNGFTYTNFIDFAYNNKIQTVSIRGYI